MSYYKYHYLSLKKSEYEKLYAFHSVLKTFMLSNDWNRFWEGLNYFEDPLNIPKINIRKIHGENKTEYFYFEMNFESHILRRKVPNSIIKGNFLKTFPETLQVSFQVDVHSSSFFARTSVLWFGNKYIKDLEKKFAIYRLFDEKASIRMRNWKELEQVAHDFIKKGRL